MLGNCCLGDGESQSPSASHLLVSYADFQEEEVLGFISYSFFFLFLTGKESGRWPAHKQADWVSLFKQRQDFTLRGLTAGETACGET